MKKITLQDMPVYFINMKNDLARRKNVKDVLSQSGFTDVTWVEGIKGRTKTIGCALAHARALEYALEKNVFPCIIVEDDILLYRQYDEVSFPHDADALYLGLSSYGLHGGKGVRRHAVERVGNGVYRLLNMLAAHAIVYFNREYVEYLLGVNKIFVAMNTNQDKGRAETMKYWKVYGLAEPMFYQSDRYEPVTKITLPNAQSTSLDFFYRG